jgi:hypothetical protein
MAGGIDEFLSAADDPAFARTVSARILPPSAVGLLNRHRHLEEELDRAAVEDSKLNRDPQMPVIAQQLLDLEAEIAGAKSTFVFKCVGTSAWLELSSKFPPTKAQLATNKMADHDPDRFQPAAIAASCIDPVMTVEQAKRLRDVTSISQWAELWQACVQANMGTDSPKSTAAGAILRVKQRFDNTAAAEGSPEASFSDE